MSDGSTPGSSKQGLLRPAGSEAASPPLSPNDHLRLLVELLRPAGPELARRWVAALLLAPESDRVSIVESVERRMAELYAPSDAPNPKPDASPVVRLHAAPVQREGYVEQRVETVARAEPVAARPTRARKKHGA